VDISDKVEALLDKCIDGNSTFVVDTEVKGSANNLKIQVFVDGDESVDVAECASISRRLSALLEEGNVIDGQYVIEVSSPGAGRPLKYLRQYAKHVGRDMEISTSDQHMYEGKLVSVNDGGIGLSVPPQKAEKGFASEVIHIEFEKIDTARVLVRF
jgi:ribosome maturation factor RimP